MPTIDIRMFSEQTEGTESFIGVWLKKPGDRVVASEPLVEISTDKVSMEIPSPASGVLREILKHENEPVAPGEVLGRIERDDAAGTDAAAAMETAVRGETTPKIEIPVAANEELSPAVRRLIRENNLNPESIPATGRGGRLTYRDVADFLSKQNSGPKVASRLVPHTPMRRMIAGRMLRSAQSAPLVTSVFEANLSRVIAGREAFRSRAAEPPSITAYLIQAAVRALAAVPEANSRWRDNDLEIFEDFNIGIGTALKDGGLIVPVIHRAQNLTLAEISTRLRELTTKAREGALSTEEVQNGTFTISNHGVSGSLLAAPILIPDFQSAILGVGKLQKRPIAAEEDGQDVIRIEPMMYVTLTIDHRALDGQQANAFLTAFVRALENRS